MNSASYLGQQEGGTSVLAHLHRAIDRYKAVGWLQHAEAISALLDRVSLQQTPAVWHEIEKLLIGNRMPLAHYGDTIGQLVSPLRVPPAEYYIGCDDLCIISCFFNPCGYRSRVRNFEAFIASLSRSTGVHWRSIECVFGNADFMLPQSDYILRIRSNSVLWQKERLLNLLIASLPDTYRKIAWVDADVLFSNPTWIVDASDALDDNPVVQLFTHLMRIDDRLGDSSAEVDTLESFAFIYRQNPDRALGPTYFHHGHTGLAWAGRRDWIEHCGLYDCCLSGTGDHLMAHAFVGDWQPDCIGIGQGPAYLHFVQWCERVYPSLRARLGVVPGQAISLWHGPESARDYYGAVCAIRDSGFDPLSDLRLNEDGCWEWSSNKPTLHRWTYEYFFRRRCDPFCRNVRSTRMASKAPKYLNN